MERKVISIESDNTGKQNVTDELFLILYQYEQTDIVRFVNYRYIKTQESMHYILDMNGLLLRDIAKVTGKIKMLR